MNINFPKGTCQDMFNKYIRVSMCLMYLWYYIHGTEKNDMFSLMYLLNMSWHVFLFLDSFHKLSHHTALARFHCNNITGYSHWWSEPTICEVMEKEVKDKALLWNLARALMCSLASSQLHRNIALQSCNCLSLAGMFHGRNNWKVAEYLIIIF